MRKALIQYEPYETGKQKILAIGAQNYTPKTLESVVDLTDWPIFNNEKASKEDVYYSDTLINGAHFIIKWLNFEEKETHKKKEKIYNLATQKIIAYGYAVQIREYGESKGITRGLIPTQTLTDLEDSAILQWIQDMGTKHNSFDLSTITLDDIYIENTLIFPTLPLDPKLNGFT